MAITCYTRLNIFFRATKKTVERVNDTSKWETIFLYSFAVKMNNATIHIVKIFKNPNFIRLSINGKQIKLKEKCIDDFYVHSHPDKMTISKHIYTSR